MQDVPDPPEVASRARTVLRLTENAHLPFGRLTALSKVAGLRYPHPSSLRRTSLYASFLAISSRSQACGMDIFHQPHRSRFFDSLIIALQDKALYAAVIPAEETVS